MISIHSIIIVVVVIIVESTVSDVIMIDHRKVLSSRLPLTHHSFSTLHDLGTEEKVNRTSYL